MVVWQWHQDKHLLVWSKRKSSNLIFAPRTRFLFIFCSTQRCENRNKMNFASKQRKSLQKSIHCKFVTCRKVCYKEQFVMWSKIACHGKQFCSTWPSTISLWSKIAPHEIFAPRTMSAASATNMMYDLGVTKSWTASRMLLVNPIEGGPFGRF